MSRAIQQVGLPDADVAEYLGPADVVALVGAAVEVDLRGGGRVRADLALAFPYVPAIGDTLLIIGKAGEHWVIGVIRGRGHARLTFPGDVDLRAEGQLTLRSDKRVAIRGPELDIETGAIKMVARAVTEKFTTFYQRVRDTLSVRAGQSHTVVDDRSFTTAKNASIVSEEAMTINGNEIHLG